MNKEEFTYFLTHPEALTSDQTSVMGSLVLTYPYFQSARALYLKGLKASKSFKYNQELKITAAHTSDRSILFDFITSDAFNQNEISQLIKQNTELLKNIEIKDARDISVNKNVLIDDMLKQHMEASEGIFDPDLFQKKTPEQSNIQAETPTSIIDIDVKNIKPSPEEELGIGQPLEFDKNEARSFSEWLKITSFKPIQRIDEDRVPTPVEIPDSDSKPKAPLDKKIKLIDKFISSNPKIPPLKEYTPVTLPEKPKLVQNDSFMTETLARIYLEQKNYEKAIQSYKILILKYPEKSSFFADQIKAVEKLQENNTK